MAKGMHCRHAIKGTQSMFFRCEKRSGYRLCLCTCFSLMCSLRDGPEQTTAVPCDSVDLKWHGLSVAGGPLSAACTDAGMSC